MPEACSTRPGTPCHAKGKNGRRLFGNKEISGVTVDHNDLRISLISFAAVLDGLSKIL
jgi:hypothetical protein